MNFVTFLNLEIKEIEKHKWLESEKVGYDLGVYAQIDWVTKYAKLFRQYIEQTYGEIK